MEHQVFVHKLRASTQARDYQRAQQICEDYNVDHQLKKQMQLSELSRMQRTERLRLRSAKRIALERAVSAGEARLKDREEAMSLRQQKIQSAHDEKLQVMSTLLREKENMRPIVFSPITNQLRQSETHLARLRMFDEAAVAKAKLQHREALEAARTIKERERKVRDVIEIKKQTYLDEERTLYTRMKGDIQVQKNVVDEEARRIAAMYDHLNHDMERAHVRQRAQCERTTTVDLKTALESGTGQQSRAVRGTTMLRKIKGNRFTIPSLCDLYGSLLEPQRPSSCPHSVFM